ncbi:MAG: hypothetical protein FD157_4157, partial [Rhodocyclaceae bacterium]
MEVLNILLLYRMRRTIELRVGRPVTMQLDRKARRAVLLLGSFLQQQLDVHTERRHDRIADRERL